ncbi:MAG TPA: M20/M25/M40 family metallo-hydrolase [Bacillales bacterium]|nr:M20/M25/M40 family metallo-hydrolase [Bacillales bacterium]
MDKAFLFDLLATASPSGHEAAIQKKWMKHVEPFADQIKTDAAGNSIGVVNPRAKFKLLLAGHCDEVGFIINRIDENGFIRFTELGRVSHKPAIGMKMDILGSGGRITGVVGVNAEHHGGITDDFDFEDLYIDCGAKSKEEMQCWVKVGDPVVYKREAETLLNDRIAGRGLDNRTGAFIVAEVLKAVAGKVNADVGVYAASTVNEETNMGGAYFAGAGVKPNMAIACDVTFATDYPGVNRNKHGEIDLDGGPVLAKGAPINAKLNRRLEEAAERKGIGVQYELTPRMTGTDADRIRVTGRGVPVALVSLPLRYMHAPVETVSLKDIEEEIELLADFLVNLKGNEKVGPLD